MPTHFLNSASRIFALVVPFNVWLTMTCSMDHASAVSEEALVAGNIGAHFTYAGDSLPAFGFVGCGRSPPVGGGGCGRARGGCGGGLCLPVRTTTFPHP